LNEPVELDFEVFKGNYQVVRAKLKGKTPVECTNIFDHYLLVCFRL
jgi:hypothetical protein